MSLIISDVRKSFYQGDTQIEVLKGIKAEIQNGEIVAIVGQSGSGKSTLLSLMAGLDQATSGDIIIDGQKLSTLPEADLTAFRGQKIGIVFQQFHLLQHLTALENVRLPLEILGNPGQEDLAKKVLADMGLSHRLNHFPKQLSGGECQRVAIARALVVQPKILLADEPSGNLDTNTGDQVMETFFKVIREHRVTTILVTHSMELASRCDRQLVLKQGQFQ
jgi:putative ABC transport system ATP-binding protein